MDKQNTAVYVNKYLLQGLSGVKDIKIYGREKYFTHKFSNYNKIFTAVQIPAEFPGGVPAWVRYLERNLNRDLPVEKKAPSGKYTVTVSFIVDKNEVMFWLYVFIFVLYPIITSRIVCVKLRYVYVKSLLDG